MPKIFRLALFVAACLALAAPPAPADDVVILKDGYAIRGKATKETSGLTGKFELRTYLDVVESGPKYVFFSSHARKQLAAIEKGVPKPDVVGYRRYMDGNTLGEPLPPFTAADSPRWKANWTRTMRLTTAGGYENVDQRINYIGPDAMFIYSTTHKFRQAYDTRELAPEYVTNLLRTHPDLEDPSGGVDPIRRLKIATFLKEVGWLVPARRELEKLKADLKGPWPKDVTARRDQLLKEIDADESRLVIAELETAVSAGRYNLAARIAKQYEPKSNDAKDLTRLAEIRATIDQLGPQYFTTRRLLRDLIDRTTGAATANAHGAAVGGVAGVATRLPVSPTATATLVEAATAVLAELHPDSATRLDLFRQLAGQAEQDATAGRDPLAKPDQLLSLAVSGWLRGKNGADTDPVKARKRWQTRVTALKYLRERIGNERAGILKDYLASENKLDAAELAQIVSLLPPINPEPLDKLGGKLLPPRDTNGVDRVYLRNTGPIARDANGYDYYCRLPDEYHHGRAYPLLVALTDPGIPAEAMLANLADMANRHGYILIAPKWAVGHAGPYDYTGKDHPFILGVMRDMARRFNVDSDRVFLWGVGTGGTLALDLGLGHSDQFAGLTLFGPSPVYGFFKDYWTNAQKLPIFTVTGDSAADAMRRLYELWLPRGYPSLFTVYRGRGAGWFPAEVGNAFDWMGRKVRARGVASLRLDDKGFEAWKSMRDADNRFYWVGVEDMLRGHEFKTRDRPDLAPPPAQFVADIAAGNRVRITGVRGVTKLAIWLEKDMIDWTKPVAFYVPDGLDVPRPAKMEPDLRLMFEELYRSGDKKMLFFGKVVIRHPGR